jgi:hypothetical protein
MKSVERVSVNQRLSILELYVIILNGSIIIRILEMGNLSFTNINEHNSL